MYWLAFGVLTERRVSRFMSRSVDDEIDYNVASLPLPPVLRSVVPLYGTQSSLVTAERSVRTHLDLSP